METASDGSVASVAHYPEIPELVTVHPGCACMDQEDQHTAPSPPIHLRCIPEVPTVRVTSFRSLESECIMSRSAIVRTKEAVWQWPTTIVLVNCQPTFLAPPLPFGFWRTSTGKHVLCKRTGLVGSSLAQSLACTLFCGTGKLVTNHYIVVRMFSSTDTTVSVVCAHWHALKI